MKILNSFTLLLLLLSAVLFAGASALGKDSRSVIFEIGEARRVSLGGIRQTISVTKLGAPISVSSFSFAFAWDSQPLTYFGCSLGSALSSKDWELNISDDSAQIAQSPDSPARIIRVAAEYRGSDSAGVAAPDGEWLRLDFASTGDWCYDGAFAPIVFAFISCTDNTISSANKDTLFTVLQADSSSSWVSTKRDCLGGATIAPKGVAFSPDKHCRCDKTSERECEKMIVLKNGGIEFLFHGWSSEAGRGDLNLNGVAHESDDLHVLERLLLGDVDVLHSNIQYRVAQLAAADVNADRDTATVADLQYLVRVLAGDAKPYPKLSRNSAMAEARLSRRSNDLEIKSDNEIGSVCLIYKGRIAEASFQNLSPLDMQVFASDTLTTVLLSCTFDSADLQRKLPRGVNQLLRTVEKVKLVRAESSDYDGNLLITRY